jgi:hypothetical protein
MTYDPQLVLQAIDDNVALVLLFFLGAAVFTFVFLVESFRLTRAHAAFSAPLAAVAWFAVHDLHFVLFYDLWFNVYDHWWVKAWWVALVFTTAIEFSLVGMVIKYGRKELAPWASPREFALLVVLATAAIGILWLFVKSALNDPLFLVSFPITAFWALPFSTALMLKRQSQRGQSYLLEICVIFIMLSFQGALWQVDAFFRSPMYLAFTTMAVCWGITNVWLLSRLPSYNVQTSSNEVPLSTAA